MSDVLISSKTLTLFVVAAIVLVVIAGIISYNLGASWGLKQTSNTNSQPQGNNATTNQSPAGTGASEIPVSGEPVVAQGKTTLGGTIDKISSNSFSLTVVQQTLNPATRRITQTNTTYTVLITADTQLTQKTSTWAIPPLGGPAQVTTTTKNIKSSDLKPGATVSVTTNDRITASTITALEVVVTMVARK